MRKIISVVVVAAALAGCQTARQPTRTVYVQPVYATPQPVMIHQPAPVQVCKHEMVYHREYNGLIRERVCRIVYR